MATPDAGASISVSTLTRQIKTLVEQGFHSVCLSAEISEVSRPRSGHLYLTLKDDSAQIRGVVWRSTAQRLSFEIKEGQAVICFGDVEVYAARGTYQLVIRQMQPDGIGALQLAFQELKTKLHREGLFAAERKRPLPRFPKCVAVVTSASGAALHDFLEAARNRWQGSELMIVPALVQGESAASSIVAAIRSVHRLKPMPDVLVVTRGGGSLEDLWAFNEEPLIRALAESKIPTVSAVGHEIDITLSDLVADVRALTPTDAAIQVLPDRGRVLQASRELGQRLDRAMQLAIESRRHRVESLLQRSVLRRPHEQIRVRQRRLDELDARSRRAMFAVLHQRRAQLAARAAALSALSPVDVLARGYSVTTDREGIALRDVEQVRPGDLIRTRLAAGELESVVRERPPK